MAVVTQPQFRGSAMPSEWKTGICDFCDDCGTCCYGFFCFPCLGCTIARDMDECCLCGLTMPMRSVYRTKYNIKGSLCSDFLYYQFCFVCSVCQLKRDIDKRKEEGTF
ncbi:PLAC8 protein, partial [Atractosteus spatula]|nr:PLAC8 protein [Atractosteus spatula]